MNSITQDPNALVAIQSSTPAGEAALVAVPPTPTATENLTEMDGRPPTPTATTSPTEPGVQPPTPPAPEKVANSVSGTQPTSLPLTVSQKVGPRRSAPKVRNTLKNNKGSTTEFADDALDSPEPPSDPLAELDTAGLLDLRGRIDAHLPALKLTDLNLETEIVLQYQRAKALLGRVIADTKIPTNQKAQVANSCMAILEQLVKMQGKLYSAERFKAIEQCLIKALKTLPREAQEKFFVDYERIHAEEVS